MFSNISRILCGIVFFSLFSQTAYASESDEATNSDHSYAVTYNRLFSEQVLSSRDGSELLMEPLEISDNVGTFKVNSYVPDYGVEVFQNVVIPSVGLNSATSFVFNEGELKTALKIREQKGSIIFESPWAFNTHEFYRLSCTEVTFGTACVEEIYRFGLKAKFLYLQRPY